MKDNNLLFRSITPVYDSAKTILNKQADDKPTARQKLKQLTDELVKSAERMGRGKIYCNILLKEAYDLTDKVLDTFEGWNSKDYTINKGEHGYPFWGKPITTANNITYCPVVYMFSQDQVTLYDSEYCN